MHKRFDHLLATLEELNPSDVLLPIFKDHYDDIGGWWEACFPDTPENLRYKYKGKVQYFVGESFHKGFRQMDIVYGPDEGKIDMTVWKALAAPMRDNVTQFWDAYQKAIPEDWEVDFS